MIQQQLSQTPIIYSDTDSQPIADNTRQFQWIVTIKENLDLLFANNSNVFVAGDLLWYPIEGNNTIRRAPDVMVVFGRPKGYRGSYQQWQEDNIPPQVVFEILSPGNTIKEMAAKLQFYQWYGVEEYYLYDPEKVDFAGWQIMDGKLTIIEEIQGWVSPRLGVRFEMAEELQIFTPTAERFLTFVELGQKLQQEKRRAEQAEARLKALEERLKSLGVDPNL
ncbi:Uma2 family endonuclease [Planktothrix agardhii 1029]|uniref:Uma2 family endonuclease n=1 Tax=Planktothrix agardhii TaxID=1160 RepID=UPI001F3AD812|nr:Uma2 family endonuclease [Planktothrix agardhii]MCF3589007.1 Uma2 family endonuclease [Planktothrix agardhii 1029]MCF3621528.1 Uma2 family endonuclease [Planktothrix agardhii 1030]